MKRIVVLLLMCFLLCSCGNQNKSLITDMNGKKISCEQKEKIIEENDKTVIIDVRTDEEYMAGHLDSAINIPVDNIEDIRSNSDITEDTPIIVYCRSGSRSATALGMLKELGYKYVYDLGAMSNCQ